MILTITKYSVALPVVAILYRLIRDLSSIRELKVIIILVTFFLISETVFTMTADINNLFLLVPYIIGEYILFSWLFTIQLPSIRRGLTLGMIIILSSMLLEKSFGNEWLSITRTIEGIILMVAAGAWFRKTYQYPERRIERLTFFWIALAILVYFVPTLPIFLNDVNVYQLERENLIGLYHVKNVLNIISKSLLAIAVIKW